MTIAVIGAGAIGSVVAAYLSQAGEEVCLIGRPEQVDVIQKKGLSIKGVRGEKIFPIKALSRLESTFDLTIFTVKTQDMEDAYQANSEYLEDTMVLTTQNGVQADNILSSHFDRETIISSIVMFGATYIKPGEAIFNFEGDWIIGKPFAVNDPKVENMAKVLGKAFSVVVSPNIMGMKWLKLFVNFNNCIPALTGRSMQESFSDMDLCRLSIELLKEGIEVVKRTKIEIISLPQFPVERILGLAAMPIEQSAGIIHKTLTTLSKEPLYGSILQSILRKKTSEIDYINGEVVALAKSMGSKAPLNSKVVEMVHTVEQTQRYFTFKEIKEAFSLN